MVTRRWPLTRTVTLHHAEESHERLGNGLECQPKSQKRRPRQNGYGPAPASLQQIRKPFELTVQSTYYKRRRAFLFNRITVNPFRFPAGAASLCYFFVFAISKAKFVGNMSSYFRDFGIEIVENILVVFPKFRQRNRWQMFLTSPLTLPCGPSRPVED